MVKCRMPDIVFDDIIQKAALKIEAAMNGYQIRPVMYYGDDFLMMSDLLHNIESIASTNEFVSLYIDVKEVNSLSKIHSYLCVKSHLYTIAIDREIRRHNDLTELLVALGMCAKQTNTLICLLVDRVQYATSMNLESMIVAIHRVIQLGLPVIFFCACSSSALKNLVDARSYADRLYEFVKI